VTECLTFARQGGSVGIEIGCLAQPGGSVGIETACLAQQEGSVGVETTSLTEPDGGVGIENASLTQPEGVVGIENITLPRRLDGGSAAGIAPGGRSGAGRMARGTGVTADSRHHFDRFRV